jgi:Domain of unknown function (DUF4412)
MRTFVSFCAAIFFGFVLSARGDLTIVQTVESTGQPADMTIKIKGDKVRMDNTPQIAMLIDGKSGEIVTLMRDQKTFVRMSAEKIRAAAEMANKYSGQKDSPVEKPKLTRTGKTDTVNGYKVEEYSCETPVYKASYWIALEFPNGAAILKQFQAFKQEIWNPTSTKMPDYRDFPGLPVKTVMSMSGTQVTSTITSVNQNPISDAEFAVPADYKERKLPDMSEMLKQEPVTSPSP